MGPIICKFSMRHQVDEVGPPSCVVLAPTGPILLPHKKVTKSFQ